MRIQDRQGRGPELLAAATDELVAAARRTPGLTSVFSPFTANTPQMFVEIDRVKGAGNPRACRFRNVTDAIETYFGLDLCQRLQYSRPHLSRHGAGGLAVPQGDRRSWRCSRTSNAAPQHGAVGERRFPQRRGTGSRCALQSRPGIGTSGRHHPRNEFIDGHRHHEAPGRTDATERLLVRLDGFVLPAGPRRQLGPLCIPDLRAVRIPGAGSAIWQLEPAVRRDSDRTDAASWS